MKKFTMFACVAMTLVFALSSVAGELPALSDGHNSVLYGGSFAKASGDTIDVMGPSGTYQGDFENAACDASKGLPVGWTSYDITQPTVTHWSVSTVNNDIPGISGQSMWCGDFIDACVAADSAWGYGNAWHDIAEFRKTVANPAVSTTVTIAATLFYDSEPGYDYTYLSYKMADAPIADLQTWDGEGTVAVSNSVTYLPGEYENGNEVVIMFRFKSDGGWSDGDCSWPTRGASNVDDVTVTVGATPYFDDFDAKGWGNWAAAFPSGVGDYAQIWCSLEDVDPCNTNFSNQVAFIDDGIVVAGTNGSTCINWCYGPAGYIVNTTGGLAGPNEHLYNALESPVMPWPNATYDGIITAFNAYRHEDLTADAPGIFYTWSVRSADTDNSAGNGVEVITDEPWLDRNFVYYGGPDYLRVINDVTDLMNAGRDEIQLQVTAYELGYIWGWDGDDGYPAPFFDNFNVKVFPVNGPSIVTREIDIANDNFPTIGVIDTGNLAANSVRFDMANNISLAAHLRNDPGDTIVFDVVPVRSGSVLSGTPTLHWVMDQNPVFGATERTSVYGMATSGTSLGTPAVGASGIPDPDAWAFDLPDENFLYPGDVLHYYIEAFDDVSGDIKAATMPGDLTGYGDFSHPLAYNTSFVVHALPSLASDGFGGYTQPGLLFLNDFANRGGEAEWYGAFDNLGLLEGRDYDIYYTNGPSSGVGNGIGGRAAIGTITGYSDIVYTAGDLGVNTISNGDYDNDAGDDVGLLTQWVDLGGKDMFLTGDDLASDLAQAGTATLNFLQNYMGLSVFSNDVRPLIGGQATPTVKAVAGNGVIVNVSTWVAYGGCLGINTFDAVTVTGGATRLAEFLDPNGLAGAYTYSAATKKAVGTSRVVSMPYDFMFIYNDPGAKVPAPLSARAQVLKDVLSHFGIDSNPGDVSEVPDAVVFSSKNYPNPFNPTTKIEFTMPKTGHLTLKIYNVRGELVRTLIDEVRSAGTDHVMWDGTSDAGSSVSSGVYFYEARYGDEVQVQKMALVK